MTLQLQQAIEHAAGLAYEEDADHYVINDDHGGWLVVHEDDPAAYAPGVVHRFTVHGDGVDQGHIARGEITEDWELPE